MKDWHPCSNRNLDVSSMLPLQTNTYIDAKHSDAISMRTLVAEQVIHSCSSSLRLDEWGTARRPAYLLLIWPNNSMDHCKWYESDSALNLRIFFWLSTGQPRYGTLVVRRDFRLSRIWPQNQTYKNIIPVHTTLYLKWYTGLINSTTA